MAELPSIEQRQAHVTATEVPGSGGLLLVAVSAVVVTGLYLGRSVLIPITLAVLLSFLLAPFVNLLRRLYFGRVLSVFVAVLVALTVILVLGGLIGTQLATVAEEVPRYAITIRHKIDSIQQLILARVTSFARPLTRKSDQAAGAAKNRSAAAAGTPSGDTQKLLQVEVHQPDPTTIELARRIVTPVVEPLSTTAIVLVVSIFILLQREDLRDRMIRLFGSSDLHRTTVAMNDAARRLSRYLLTQLAVNASFGVIVTCGLAFLGVPSPIMWGILGALLRFAPYVGAPLAALVPLTLAAAIDPGWSLLLWTASLYFVLEVIIGQVVEPMLYGRSTGLSPFAVVVAATFWTWLWGPIGLILSTPLTLCLVVLGRHVAHLEFLEVLLGDRPALTPVESFYQRMLAGDPDEAHDQAEVLLKGMSLASYYDEVALNGLRLAAIDAERGALTPAHLARLRLSIRSLIEDLDDHEDSPASPGEAQAAETSAAEPPAPGLPRAGLPADVTPAGVTRAGVTPAGVTRAAETPAPGLPAPGLPAANLPASVTPAAPDRLFRLAEGQGRLAVNMPAGSALPVTVPMASAPGGDPSPIPLPTPLAPSPESSLGKPAAGGPPATRHARGDGGENRDGQKPTSSMVNSGLVLCVSGRGPLDEEAAAMLAQLLQKQGLAARVVPYASTARGAIGALDVGIPAGAMPAEAVTAGSVRGGVLAVCISYVELSGSPSHLRYLMRRLRARLPRGVPVLVGMWPDTEEILHDERLRAAVGADSYTSSLRDAVAKCQEISATGNPGTSGG
jgi:predicted PurR-regulated permease PerM